MRLYAPKIVVEDMVYDPTTFGIAGKKLTVLEACCLCVIDAMGEVTQGDLCDALGVRQATASDRIHKLKGSGFIQPVGGRPTPYRLSPKGRRALGLIS